MHMEGFKFDTSKLRKLNDPERLEDIPPEYIKEKMNVQTPEVLLDIGAGTGFFSKEFTRFDGVRKVYALDIAEEMIDWMKTNLAPVNEKVIPMKMQESSVDLPDHIADGVIMINLHHEFHEPLELLQECRRLMKPGAKLAIVDWAKKDTEHGPPKEKRYTTDQVTDQLRQVGFTDVESFEELPNHFLVVAGHR